MEDVLSLCCFIVNICREAINKDQIMFIEIVVARFSLLLFCFALLKFVDPAVLQLQAIK